MKLPTLKPDPPNGKRAIESSSSMAIVIMIKNFNPTSPKATIKNPTKIFEVKMIIIIKTEKYN